MKNFMLLDFMQELNYQFIILLNFQYNVKCLWTKAILFLK